MELGGEIFILLSSKGLLSSSEFTKATHITRLQILHSIITITIAITQTLTPLFPTHSSKLLFSLLYSSSSPTLVPLIIGSKA